MKLKPIGEITTYLLDQRWTNALLYSTTEETVFIWVSPFQNNPKYLDPSYKMDLDIREYFGREEF